MIDEQEISSFNLEKESDDGQDLVGDYTVATGSQCILSSDILSTHGYSILIP